MSHPCDGSCHGMCSSRQMDTVSSSLRPAPPRMDGPGGAYVTDRRPHDHACPTRRPHHREVRLRPDEVAGRRPASPRFACHSPGTASATPWVALRLHHMKPHPAGTKYRLPSGGPFHFAEGTPPELHVQLASALTGLLCSGRCQLSEPHRIPVQRLTVQ